MTDTATTTQNLTHVRIVNGGAPEFITAKDALAEIEAGMRDLEEVRWMTAEGSTARIILWDGTETVIRPATADDKPVATPEWGTLKGMTAPFTVWLDESEGGMLYASGDRKGIAGKPVVIVAREYRGTNYGTTADGRKVHFWGVATKMWRHQ